MRAVVTGGLGFIGSHVVDVLLAGGWDVTVVDDGRTATYTADELWSGRVQMRPQPVDDIHVAPECDAIFHLASPVGPVGVLGQAGMMTKTVVDAAWRVAHWSNTWDAPTVFVSTSEVYGGGNDGLCSESMPRIVPAEQSIRLEYQTAKLAAETMLRNLCDVRIIRPFNVAGPRQSAKGGFVVPRFIQQGRNGDMLTVYGDGTQQRAFTHVKDVAAGVVAALDGKPGSVFNLGNPKNRTTIDRLARLVADKYDVPILYTDPKELHGPDFEETGDKFPDPDLAIRQLGWEPIRTLRQVVDDADREWDDRLAA